MSNLPGTPIVIAQGMEIHPASNERGICISASQWGRYMSRVTECGDSSNTYQSIGWGAIGFAGNALFAAATFPFGVQWKVGGEANLFAFFFESAFVVFALTFGITGGVTLFFSKEKAKDAKQRSKWLAEDMKEHGERFTSETETAPRQSPQPQIQGSGSGGPVVRIS